MGSSTPYWSRINSEKTCPLMVFWNLSVWALNGAENWIVPKDCWRRRKKRRLGHLVACLSRSLLTNHRDCINASFTQLAPSSLDNGSGPMSVAANFIWKIAQKCHRRSGIMKFNNFLAASFGRLLLKLIMYASSLPGLFIRALMRNKKRKKDLKFRPDPGWCFI